MFNSSAYLSPSSMLYKRVYGSDIDNMKYNLLNTILYTMQLYTGNPKISLGVINELIQLRTGNSRKALVHAFMTDTEIGVKILEDIKDALQEALNPASKTYYGTEEFKKTAYENTILAIDAYLSILAQKRSITNKILRPTQKSLKNMFKKDKRLRSYLLMNLVSRDLGFDPIFFDAIDESLILNGKYALHHIDLTRSWSIYIKDLLLTSKKYHVNTYPRTRGVHQVTTQDTKVALQALQDLIELGLNNYKKSVATTDLVTEKDIKSVLGGVKLDDGRTLLEWWKNGNGKGVKPTISFNDRITQLNDRIEYLASNGQDYEKLVIKFYPKLGPKWISEGKGQLIMYQFIKNHPYAKNQLYDYIPVEDISFVEDKWGAWP